MRAIAWTMACVLALVSACRTETEPCVELRAELELERIPCEIAPGGWFLSRADDELIIEKLDADDHLVEFARIPGSACGTLTEDPDSGAIWVVVPGPYDTPGPDTLYKLDADGNELFVDELGSLDTIARTRQLAVLDGDLIRTATVRIVNPDMTMTWALSLERHDETGELLWSRAVDYPGVAGGIPSSAGGLQVSAEAIAFLAYKTWLDSSTVNLLAVDPADGELRWQRLLVADDYEGPRFVLAGDEQGRLFLGQQDDAVYDYDPETDEPTGLLSPAQTTLSVLGPDGEPLSSVTTEWPDADRLSGSSLVYRDGELAQIITARAEDYEVPPTISVIRHGADGGLLCREPIPELDGGHVAVLVGVDDERLVLLSEGEQEPRLFVLGVPL